MNGYSDYGYAVDEADDVARDDVARAAFDETFATFADAAEFAEWLIQEHEASWAEWLYESPSCPDHIADQLHDEFRFGDSVLEGRQRNR